MRARGLIVTAILGFGGLSATALVPGTAGAASTRSCGTARAGEMTCLSWLKPRVGAPPKALGAIPYSPATIKAAYGFPTSPTVGAGTTIAIVDAFDNNRMQA